MLDFIKLAASASGAFLGVLLLATIFSSVPHVAETYSDIAALALLALGVALFGIFVATVVFFIFGGDL